MLFFVKVLLIASLVKLLIQTNKPVWCAEIYAAFVFIMALIFGKPLIVVIIASAIAFCLAFLYFWLLNKFEDSGLFWLILILGLLVGLV
jgi:hypothetical protein